MDIERIEQEDSIIYQLHVVGERYCIKTWGTRVDDHLVVLASQGRSHMNLNPRILAVYDLRPGICLEGVILSDFKRYVRRIFGNSEIHETRFSEALERLENARGPERPSPSV